MQYILIFFSHDLSLAQLSVFAEHYKSARCKATAKSHKWDWTSSVSMQVSRKLVFLQTIKYSLILELFIPQKSLSWSIIFTAHDEHAWLYINLWILYTINAQIKYVFRTMASVALFEINEYNYISMINTQIFYV